MDDGWQHRMLKLTPFQLNETTNEFPTKIVKQDHMRRIYL